MSGWAVVAHVLRQRRDCTAMLDLLGFYDATTQETKPPCLFLSQSQCLVYPVRPVRCRAQHSPDRSACERHYLGQQATMPLIRAPALLFKSLQIGMRIGLHEAGLQNVRLALYSAMRIALERPDALERWLDGKAAFDDAALPEEGDEGQLLVQLMQQSRGQVRAEARRLHPIIATLLEQPGAWALYSTTGQVPPNPSG